MFTRRPAEIITGLIALVGAGVTWGVLDEATAAWIVAGLGAVPGIITGIVEYVRARPV